MNKKLEIEIYGEEVITHYQVISVEVPAIATNTEIEQIASRYLEDATDESKWKVEDSTGVCGNYTSVEVVGELGPHASVTCKLRRDENHKLVLQKT